MAADTAWRMMTQRDPYVNMLRATMATFSAGLGGANAITVLPHTLALGLPDPFARRVARNTQLVLLEESNLAKVTDPAAGSGGIESLTQQLCDAAWSLFQEIEKAGGARATFAKSFFETGGIEAIDTEGFTDPAALAAVFRTSGAALACLCSQDKVYAGQATAAAKALQAAGAKHIYLAGRANEQEAALRAAGVNDFVFAGGDALNVLPEAYPLIEGA